MNSHHAPGEQNAPALVTVSAAYSVTIHVEPATGERHRLTVAFRIILAVPHLLLVGGPLAAGLSWSWTSEGGYRLGTGGGVPGAVMVVVAVIGWSAILRPTVALRIVLALPHIVVVWVLGLAWAVTTVIAWFVILFRGRCPPGLYTFGVGVLRWSTRLEAYLLLLRDEYPPFSFA